MEGVIQPGYKPPETSVEVPGTAICAKEPGRDLDLYFDFTYLSGPREHNILRAGVGGSTDHSLQPDLLAEATTFSKSNANTCFSLLRVWSTDYFYPLMLGATNRDCKSNLARTTFWQCKIY